MPYQAMSMNSTLPQPTKPRMKQPKTKVKICLETKPYEDFKFNHMFSMLVVGPSQCGKTYFVEQLPTIPCVKYPNKKPRRIEWFYNQWQPRYNSLQSALGNDIQFTQGLPELSEDLHEINPKFNNVLVFDDLMAQATDSPVLSKLFTQGRHRNASVTLLLQNMFPKGKFNTDITRNTQYMVLFRSPCDRKQIDIIAERIFAKDRPNLMEAYTKETSKPYGYVLIDNQPKTPPDKQVVSNVFCECQRYPSISANADSSREALVMPEKRKVDFESPAAKKPKRENQAKIQPRAVKIPPKKQTKPKPTQKPKKSRTRQQAKTQSKAAKKPKRQPKKQSKTPRYNESQTISDEETHEFNFEHVDMSSDDEVEWANSVYSEPVIIPRPRHCNGFGPRYVY